MRTVHETAVRAPAGAVFAIGAEVERWPQLDPAYLWCRVLTRQGDRTVFEMAGNIRGWPGRWTASQELSRTDGRIVFLHLRGLTRGMRVVWQIDHAEGGSRLRITHDFQLLWPVIGRPVSDWIIGPLFIDWIARRTLVAVQRAAESRTNPAGSPYDPAASSSQVRTGEHGGTG